MLRCTTWRKCACPVAIDRLGERLRSADGVASEDLEMLQRLRREYDEALVQARTTIVDAVPSLSPTSRLKTVQTLVGKLQREEKMALSRVQDIAGLRVVRKMSLAEQDDLTSTIVSAFPDAKVVDRRAKPSFGYRAVHVVVKVDGRPVEIQLRTHLQDRWAQIVERMADHWGRNIRYGAEPDEPTSLVARYSRAEVVEMARRLSPLIDQCEKSESMQGRRISLSNDLFCRSVADTMSLFGRLGVIGTMA
jgi:ppGpp synthetase/RelA/SpoT-type nucleotidyltranferase